MDTDRNGLEILDRRECLRLLSGATFGRVGITSGALPLVLPVTFRLIGEHIVFSTAPGAKLESATRHAVIAFEVDHFDVLTHSGWSVMVTGVARPVTDPAEESGLWAAGVPRWLSGDGARLVILATDRVSGRRLAHDRAVSVTADGSRRSDGAARRSARSDARTDTNSGGAARRASVGSSAAALGAGS